MSGTHVYIDGLNFYYGAVQHTGYKWVDFAALARLLLPDDDIGLVHYFTAIIKPFYPGDRGHERQNALLRAMDADPLVRITKGHFRSDDKWRALVDDRPAEDLFRPELRPSRVAREVFDDAAARRTKAFTAARVRIHEEKGSDVNLGAHLLYDAIRGECQKAVVVTNDSDLAEPIRLAVDSGTPVGLVNPHRGPTSKHLRQNVSFEIKFRPDVLAKCQMPDVVRTRRGRQVHRPAEWGPEAQRPAPKGGPRT